MALTHLPPANWVERGSYHAFRFRKRSRTVADTAEEAYLRLDIPCGSPACSTCLPTSPALAPVPHHLLMPDAAVLADFLELFELPDMENVVLLNSVLRQLHDGGSMRRTARLRALYNDRRRHTVLFDNLHHSHTAPANLREQRDGSALLATAEWYYEHLGRELPVVVVSDQLARQFGAGEAGAHVESATASYSGKGNASAGASQSTRLNQQQQPQQPWGQGRGPSHQQDKQQQQQQQQQRHGLQVPGGAGLDGDDAELDALLAQMHIQPGATCTTAAVAGPPHREAAWDDKGGSSGIGDTDIGSLLDSLGIGDSDSHGSTPSTTSQLGAPAAQSTSLTHQPQQQQQQLAAQATDSSSIDRLAPLVLEPGVHILSAAEYFNGCWGHVPAVADVFDSIQQAKAEEAAARTNGGGAGDVGSASTGFRPHLSPAALEAGLAAGTLLSGTLSVSKRVRWEGSVAVGGGRTVAMSGRGAMNRALHGDRVALRLLPREHWRPVAASEQYAAAGASSGTSEGGKQDREEEEGWAEEGEEEEDEHYLLAAAGDGEADVAVDEASGGRDDEALDALDLLLADHPATSGQGAGGAVLQPVAEVVGILQRSSGEVVACIAEEDERALAAAREQDSGRQEAVLCIPLDRRLPKIRLRSRQLHRLLGQRLVLRLEGWERSSRYPHAHLVRALGPINSLTTEMDGVLVSSGVHWQPFSEGALRELPPIASSAQYQMPAAEVAARRDMRGPEYLICSIDPPGCTDVDDALSVRWLEPGDSTWGSFSRGNIGSGSSSSSSSGNDGTRGGSGSERRLVEVGVHIADVSYFVKQGGVLDGEAASRCTTVYLVGRRLDMLPPLLSEDLCSLRSGTDRYAVSVLWLLDADSLEVLDVWYGRTIIRSRYQLEYSQAQAVMEGRPQPLQPPSQGRASSNKACGRGSDGDGCKGGGGAGGGTGEQAVPPEDLPVLQHNLCLLAALAEHRRQMRLQAGAVELESAELRFNTDAEGRPTAITVKQEIPMMRIVAEMMILANAAVGQRIHQAFPRAALLRRHPPPRREAFAEVSALCDSLGTPLDLQGGPAALSASLAAAAAAAPPSLGSLIRSLATQAMSEAEYFCTGDVTGRGGGGMSHFGLALPYYTHFTSPIRRYADVVVHRQLLAAVAADISSTLKPQQQLPPPPLPGGEVAEAAAVMNERHRTAKRAQKECSDLFLLLLLHSQPHVETATIYGLRGTALLVFLPKYHLKGVIHLTDKAGVCRPPLQQPGEEEKLEDPFVLSYRRGLMLVAEEALGSSGAPRQLSIVEGASMRQVASYRPMQRIWVQLSADGSRAHGPRLRMRLLAEEHPAAVQAAGKEAAEAAEKEAGVSAELSREAAGKGDSVLQSHGAGRAAHRPLGINKPAGTINTASQLEKSAAAQRALPPGFGPPAASATVPPIVSKAVDASAVSVSSTEGPAPTPSSSSDARLASLSLAAQLQAFLVEQQRQQWEQQQGQQQAGTSEEMAGRHPLACQAILPPLEHLPSSGGGSISGSAGPLERLVQRALRTLEARAARLRLRAAAVTPGGHRAEQCSAAAAAVWQQIVELQQHLVPG